MDADELQRRLEEIRERIRQRLAEEGPAELPDATPADLELEPPPRSYPVPGHPSLNSTLHLEEANRRAEITGPVRLSSDVPVVGPLLTAIRKLLRPLVQALIDPYLDRQERFNVEVVRHLNELGQRLEKRVDAVYEELRRGAADPRFLERRLEASLADYDAALRERHTMLFDALEQEVGALESALAAAEQRRLREMHDFEVRFVQRAQAVDRRFDEKDEAMAQREKVVRETVLAQQDVVRNLQRSIDAVAGVDVSELRQTRALLQEALAAVREGHGGSDAAAGEASAEPWQRLDALLEGADYHAFQQRFRGDPEVILSRFRDYVQRFSNVPGPVADLGCGRGEFLELLADAGHEAIGVEVNAAEVADGRSRGLEVVEADLFDWLEAREEGSLGGIFLAEVIEHLPPRAWQRLVRLAATRLMPGGRLLVETINPESLYALVRAYVLDPTHVRPVHPDLLAFLAARAGFHPVKVDFQAEVPAGERILPIDETIFAGEEASHRLVRLLNDRLRRIDELCCAPQEYVLDAERPVADP